MSQNDSPLAALSQELIKKEGRGLRLYFVGIGGSGMYPLACLAASLGHSVRGSDAAPCANLKRLCRLGIPVFQGVEPLPEETDALIFSLAVCEDHPLMREARQREIPILSRAELLSILERRYPIRIAVAGSHGKSSTVAMCASVLEEAGLSPTVLLGADLSLTEGGFRKGEGDILLYEACEYKSALSVFSPTHAIVLNAEWEHADCFSDREAVLSLFHRFLATPSVKVALAPRSVGFGDHADFGRGGRVVAEQVTERDGCCSFLLRENGVPIGEAALSVMGAHQVENAEAVTALARCFGISSDKIIRGLSAYQGIGRRMERVGSIEGSPLYLDYAHHPTELKAALSAAEGLGKRVVCVFEPHTYSRVRAFWQSFLSLLSRADTAVLPIFAARETDDLGVSSQLLARLTGAEYLPSYAACASYLLKKAKEPCVLLLAGAGGIGEVVALLKEHLRA